MTAQDAEAGLPLPSDLAIPRDEAGAPVFQEPWEARIFSMVVSLNRAGAFEWKEFQRLLIEEIARSEAAGNFRPYYLNWAMAAERLFEGLDFASRAAVDARVAALRPEDKTIRLR